MAAAIKPAFKPGQSVKARSTSGAVRAGKFVKERQAAKGAWIDVDLGADGGGIKSFRPAQVTAA